MINYAADPRFQVIREGEIPVYFLKDEYITELHKSREVEAQIQNIYSNSGATAEYLSKFCDELILKLENDTIPFPTLHSVISLLFTICPCSLR